MTLSPTVVEAASWRLASEIARRHPQLIRIAREHPGGGQYDVLALRSIAGLDIMLNRSGTIQVHSRHDHGVCDWEPTEWIDYLRNEPREFMRRLEVAAGLPSVAMVPASTPATLVYRVIAGIAATSFMTVRPIEIEPGYVDTSGYGGGPASWLDMFPVSGSLRRPLTDDPFGESGYRFWMCKRPGLMLAFETSSGSAWATTGTPVDLMQTYQSVDRDIDALALTVMRHGAADE
ncbi:TY-Chap2 family putative peptide chaperone [Kribbella sp. CA-293567]|uniref:TY-Chap2 family putative peptide chaperone n=1 Tax=Kribbella sp. CA-293567 TaxID=3002436 RepID=UPI0022DCF6A9|nr:hypothetical protein [Kribbella sp. CA-293567]WBQ04463.1 hypothetical protein OX958_31435 [Kribbella sp. CA-293567]